MHGTLEVLACKYITTWCICATISNSDSKSQRNDCDCERVVKGSDGDACLFSDHELSLEHNCVEIINGDRSCRCSDRAKVKMMDLPLNADDFSQ
jgi:hypothetical protein